MKIKDVTGYIISVCLCLFAGVIGSVFTYPSIPAWYASLLKPPFNPPNWVFGPVWTILYILMGISAYIIWKKDNPYRKAALWAFSVQLVLNILWSAVFFGGHQPTAAFIVIILLWLCIYACVRAFWWISRTASVLMMPYLLWVSFASALNLAVAVLNR